MAQFDASINLNVNSSKAEQQVKRLEAAVDKVNRAASKLDFNNKNLDKAAAAAERLYKALEKIESAALSKLPTSVQTLIAYLKAANVATAKLTANAVGAAVGFKQLSGVSFAPIIRQEKQVRDLLFEIIAAQIKFQNAARNFRPRLSGQNPFQYILDGLDLVQVKIIQTEKLLQGFGQKLNRLGGAGGGSGGSGGSGGGRGGGSQRALPPGDFGFLGNPNTLRGLQVLRAQLQDLLDTTVIGSRQFRQLENAIAGVNVKIRDAQLKGQRGGSGVAGGGGAGRRGSGQGGIGAAIGFPLLFGGGAGSIAGGVIGSILDDFNGAILGSGIGSTFDRFAEKTVNLAKALDGVGGAVEALTPLIGTLDKETATLIQNLEKSGQAAAASDAAFEQLSDVLGEDLAKATVQAGQDLEKLGTAVQRFFTFFGAQFAQFVQEALYLNLTDPTGNQDQLTAAARLQRIESGQDVGVAQLQEQLAQAQLNGETAVTAELERRIIKREEENAIRLIQIGIDDKSIEAGDGLNRILEVQIKARTKLLGLQREAADETERQLREQERARQAEQRELERQARERERAARELDERQRKFNSAAVNLIDVSVQARELDKGRIAAIDRELQFIERKQGFIEQNIILSEKDLQTQQLLLDVSRQKMRNKERELQLERARIQLAQQSQLDSISRSGEDFRRGITNESAGIALGLQDPFGSSQQIQEQVLALEQMERRTAALLPLQREVNDLEKEALALRGKEDQKATESRQNRINALNTQILANSQALEGLEQLELAQSRYNRVLEAAQPFAEAFATGLTQGLRDVVAGTKTAEEAFADFLNNIADLLAQTAAQMIAQYIAIGIARTFAGIPPGSSGSDFSQFGTNTTGVPTNFIGSGLSGFSGLFADGGTLGAGKWGIAGEAGPEIVSGPATITPMTGGDTVVNITVNSSGGSTSTSQGDKAKEAAQLGRMVEASVVSIINREKRPGGILTR